MLIEDRAYSVPVSPDHQHASGEIDIAALHAQDSTGLLDRIDRAVVWDIPLVTPFRGITRRDGVLLHGPGGWGEVAPFWDYGSGQCAMARLRAVAGPGQLRPAPLPRDHPC